MRLTGNHTTRSLSLSVAGAIALVVALAGCVGIPSGGAIVSGDVIDEDSNLGINFLPPGPTAGASQGDIMRDFIQAATNPQGNYETARQFLSSDVRKTWNPDSGVTIRRGTQGTTTVSGDNIDYTIASSASITASGQYREDQDASNQTLHFEFVQEDGEWRISALDDGIVLSEDNFDVVFASHALYFFDPTFQYLVPDVRWFPATSTIATRIANALVAGPVSWLTGGVVVSGFPPGTTLGDVVTVTSGTATVDLSEEARDASDVQKERMRQQLSASLANVSTVSSVAITIGGVPLVVPDAGVVQAVQQPTVDPAPLVRIDEEFAYVTASTSTPIPGLSEKVIDIDATGGTLSPDGNLFAARAADGVYAVRSGSTAPLLLDTRQGLVDPTLDVEGFVWSARAAAASSILAFEPNGESHVVATKTLPADARIVSMDISRDGSRIALYLSVGGQARLVVAGIVRQQDNVPIAFGEIVELPVSGFTPLDATWVDDRTVATISRSDDDAVVTAYEIGGPSVTLGRVSEGVEIVGGNGGTDGIRVRANDGAIFKSRGSTWQDTRVTATFMATQQ